MTTIKDSVHSHIELGGVAADLLDTPPVQRLRYVRQLGTVSLVYPSANHTRFEHSIGVYHLVDRACAHLGIDGRAARRLRAAAMLHDVGHTPYSHNLEPVLRRATGRGHDDIGHLVRAPPVADVLEAHDLDPDRVVAAIDGEGRYGQLLAGELDVDRMDYLVRDAHHTGVPYGTIDPGRLLRELRFIDGELVLDEGNVQSAESLLVARALMNPTVYNHHVARISKSMVRRAIGRLLEDGSGLDHLDPVVDPWPSVDGEVHPLRRAADHDVLVALRASSATAPLLRRLVTRDLYKRAIWAEREAVPEEVRAWDRDACRAAEREIADRAGVDPSAVIIDLPPRTAMREARSRVLVNGEVRRLAEQSPLVRALQEAHDAQWRLGVYAPREHAERVGSAAVAVLDLVLGEHRVHERGHGLYRQLREFTDP